MIEELVLSQDGLFLCGISCQGKQRCADEGRDQGLPVAMPVPLVEVSQVGRESTVMIRRYRYFIDEILSVGRAATRAQCGVVWLVA